MPSADLVIFGTVLTVDEHQPTAEAIAVSDGRIVAVGDRSQVESWIGPGTQKLDIDGCVMPGLIEAHGHPLMEAIVLSDRMVDIRPVTLPNADDVVDAIRREVAKRGAEGAYLNGWDPLLQNGLPEPTIAWLDGQAPDTPLVIVHNSGHKAYFNAAAAARSGLTRDTPDPKAPSTATTPTANSTAPPRRPARCSACWSVRSSPPTIRRCCTTNSAGSIAVG